MIIQTGYTPIIATVSSVTTTDHETIPPKESSNLTPLKFSVNRKKLKAPSFDKHTVSQKRSMRKSKSLEADHKYSVTSIQSPLWVTLTNARTIEELTNEEI
ncbi:uncharacterized protein LOC119643283 [Glossina fuscipes]|uniref:Uncharacterized protein LOC119643283 n=1 Tax=Glossina fuscipes TaxID=7396 RepID=A0A9C5ZBC4_9MUSC|nr:uncharacterized protein LOC119643283 [Glossina fuscipes]